MWNKRCAVTHARLYLSLEAKKKYDKETEKYCAVLEKHLSLSARKKESHLHEADNQVDNVRQHFYELLAFLQGLFTYYHHGYELAKDFNHFKTDLTISIQNTRNRFESTRSEVESSFVSTWVKYYCTYHREPKRVTMVLFDPKSGGKMGEEESFMLKSCTRRKTDSIEKRFCFDVEAVDRPGVITMQALSEEDRRLWMEAMDGREPVGYHGYVAQLDVVGFNVMKKFIYAVETRGIDEQGLYRIVGVNSRVQKLLSQAMDPKTCADVELENPEWEIKTITSAIKHYLRMLPAPLMTYQYQRSFIKAASECVLLHLSCLMCLEETVAAIMDIKFQNIVVEILIEHHERIFRDVPSSAGASTNQQLNLSRRKSSESKAPSCSERPLTLFHTPTHSQKGEKRNSVVNATVNELQQPVSSSANCNSSSSSSSSSQGRTPRHSLTSNDGEQDGRQIRPSSLLNPKSRGSIPTSATSPSPTSPRSPSWPMFSAPSSPQPMSSASSDSSPIRLVRVCLCDDFYDDKKKKLCFFQHTLAAAVPGNLNQALIKCCLVNSTRGSVKHLSNSVTLCSLVGRKARALYACKAEHDSELSFIAGTIFDNVHASREPGWLEGTLDGRTGLIPENYVEFL
ncbi:hypothetical protein INR49_008963 [Caranx melampygus]|nr:hypothetical protein INR49_008963 [Caranx melampygus]